MTLHDCKVNTLVIDEAGGYGLGMIAGYAMNGIGQIVPRVKWLTPRWAGLENLVHHERLSEFRDATYVVPEKLR